MAPRKEKPPIKQPAKRKGAIEAPPPAGNREQPELTTKPFGRPPKFTNPQEMQIAIDDYFESCWIDKITEVTSKEGETTTSNARYQNRPYTVMGLALALNMTRETLCEYAKKGDFSDIVKRAKDKVEMNVEEALLEGKNAAGPIFWLKNHADYRDKQELELSGEVGVKRLLEEIDGTTLGPPSMRDKK